MPYFRNGSSAGFKFPLKGKIVHHPKRLKHNVWHAPANAMASACQAELAFGVVYYFTL